MLITLVVLAAAIGAVVGYVIWRDLHQRGKHIDPSVSSDALAQAQWQAARAFAMDASVAGTPLPRNQAPAHDRHNTS